MKNGIRKSARGELCSLMIFPYCNNNPETTVLCHLGSLRKGMALKSEDYFAVYACSNCHDVIDGRMKTDLSEEEILKCQMRGLERTWSKLIEKGLVKING